MRAKTAGDARRVTSPGDASSTGTLGGGEEGGVGRVGRCRSIEVGGGVVERTRGDGDGGRWTARRTGERRTRRPRGVRGGPPRRRPPRSSSRACGRGARRVVSAKRSCLTLVSATDRRVAVVASRRDADEETSRKSSASLRGGAMGSASSARSRPSPPPGHTSGGATLEAALAEIEEEQLRKVREIPARDR